MGSRFTPDVTNSSSGGERSPEYVPTRGEKSARPRVLVVDDEPLIRWALAETLADEGFAVEQAATKAEVLGNPEVRNGSFAAILLDFRLPDSNDFKLLRTLRMLMPLTPVILMSANCPPDMTQQALEIGAFRVVHKPFEIASIVSMIRRTQ